MNIRERKRPWQRSRYTKKHSDPFYQSAEWKALKKRFLGLNSRFTFAPIDGETYTNEYCAECWKEGRKNKERIEIDHIIAIKDGGSRDNFINFMSLCHGHHNRKTHIERKKRGVR